MTLRLSASAALALAAAAAAQQVHINHTLTFLEVTAAPTLPFTNPDGVLQPAKRRGSRSA
jgi:hypothetical protein